MGITAKLAVATLRDAVKDYNYWGESESDSPLKISRTKTVLDDKKILSLDASARKKAEGIADYIAPERTIRLMPLKEVFTPLVQNAMAELRGKEDEQAGIETLEAPVEAAEYYIQLYSLFKMLENPRVLYVEDTGTSSDPYTGLFITGLSSDSETIYAQSLLIQT